MKMLKANKYKEADIKTYQWFIRKLIYLLYNIRPDIAFIIKQFNKYNINQKIGYLNLAKRVKQ